MAGILDLLGITGGQTPVGTNQTPVLYNDTQGYGSMTAGAQPQGALNMPAQPGILERMGIQTDNFTGRLGNALIAGGSRDPAGTLLALQKGDAEAANAKKPKVTPLADGAFSLITYPDGTTKVVKNEDVAKFLEEQQTTKFQQALERVKVQGQVNTQTGNDKANFKADLEQAGGPGAPTNYRESVTTQIGKIDTLLTAIPEVDKVKTALGNIESPFIANLVDQTAGRVAGTNDFKLRRDFETLVNEDVLKLAERMKGALSDKDVAFLKSIQPKADDPTDRKIEYLKELKKRLDDGEKRRMEAAVRVAGSGQGGSSAPKTSGGVVRVTNEQEWQALQPGTVYQDPNGVIRTKK